MRRYSIKIKKKKLSSHSLCLLGRLFHIYLMPTLESLTWISEHLMLEARAFHSPRQPGVPDSSTAFQDPSEHDQSQESLEA